MNKTKKDKIELIKINSTDTIQFALKRMDETFKRLLLVFKDEQFINVLSIGDIQRAIIRNLPLTTKVEEILRKKTKMAYSSQSYEDVKQSMLQFRTECMPVLDENQQLIDVYFWEDVFAPEQSRVNVSLNVPVVIMAGGKGSRLMPLTNVLPKPLLPIGEKSVLEHIMDKFVSVGCSNFFLSVNYKAELIKYYFKNLNSKTYSVSYFEEDKPLGTAGSLFLLKGVIDKPFFISNCDILIDEDYSEIYKYHQSNNNELTIVAALKNYHIPYGTIESGDDGLLKSLTEKPELTFKINSGMYILEPHLLDEIPENKFFHITELIENINNRGGRVGVFPISENSWRDIGEWDGYLNQIR